MKWKVTDSIEHSSGRLNKSVNSHTESSGLMSGQLYIVKVISHGDLTNPAEGFAVTSNDSLVRLSMKYDTITITRILHVSKILM